jgi:hypothetical protein
MRQRRSSENFLVGYTVSPVLDIPQLVLLELNWEKTKRDYEEKRVVVDQGILTLTLTRGQVEGLSNLLSEYTYDSESFKPR